MSATEPSDSHEVSELVQQLVDNLELNDDPDAPYVPFLRAVHSHSHGYAQRVPGILTPRLYELLSKLELGALVILEWRFKEYRNIREQFALPIELTQAVATREGIKHPMFQGKPTTMSVDFMLSKHDGTWEGVDIKPASEATRKRCREKLKLSSLVLAEVGIPHRVMTEKDMPPIEVRNLRFLRMFATPFDPAPLSESDMDRAEPPLRQMLSSGLTTIANAAHEASLSLGIDKVRIIKACFWLIANRRWNIDITVPIGPDYPLIFTN